METELKFRKQQYEYYREKLISNVVVQDIGKWKTLGEIATDIYRGNGNTKEQIGSGNCSCVRYEELYTTHNIWFDKCSSFIKRSA